MKTFMNEDKVRFEDLPIETRKMIACAKQENPMPVEIYSGNKGEWGKSGDMQVEPGAIYRIPPKKLVLDVWVPVFHTMGKLHLSNCSYKKEEDAKTYGVKVYGSEFHGLVHIYKEFPHE